MKTYDFKENEEVKKSSGGSKDIFDLDYDGLLVFYVINSHYSMKRLLVDYGIEFYGANIYCPFHDDELTGKQSAKYHESDDAIYCFSEQKKYTAYHALKELYKVDVKKEFYKIWADLNDSDREQFINKYSSGININFIPDLWKRSSIIVGMYRQGKVNFKQHKNALYKIATMIYEDRFGGSRS